MMARHSTNEDQQQRNFRHRSCCSCMEWHIYSGTHTEASLPLTVLNMRVGCFLDDHPPCFCIQLITAKPVYLVILSSQCVLVSSFSFPNSFHFSSQYVQSKRVFFPWFYSTDENEMHKCRYWCQCKSGVKVLLFRCRVECWQRCRCSCGDQNLNWIE